MTLDAIVAIAVSGVVLGSLYALMASGLSLVWGTLRMFNFAHGTLMMVAAYVAWTLSDESALGLPLPIAALGAILAAAALGALMELILVRPFLQREGADLIVIITTLAAAAFLVNAAQIVWGARLKQLDRVASGTVEFLGTAVSLQDVAIMTLAPTLLLGLALVLKRTRLGFAIRAVEQNRDFSRLVGVKPGRIYTLTFALSAALAGVAGVLLGGIFFVTPTMGTDPLLRAFIVVVFGGLGSLPGTVIGAYLIGLIEAGSVYFVGLYWTPVILFLILIAVMMVRPSGLLGREA
jgi:branched-chain amino acid transport system permease protein